ncbi:penicillin-binding protein 1C [Candidatus Peregrinibacteria bacterium]|nr:penicillin-binding protein 1C [Candidatus Peregrinibacteria bacterium]
MNRFVTSLIILIVLVNVFLLTFFFYPLPRALRSLQPEPTLKLYDRHDELLYEVLSEEAGRQSFIALSDMPDDLKNAFLSIEDKDFYEHSGIDLKAILRAIWQNMSAGEIVSGGSTITQQVVRNLIGVNQKRTFRQKIKESIMALKIDKFFDKDQIFEVYLNSIYFGGLAYGVESASWQYFNKSASNLDLAESAFLAGLPQAPNRYYPFEHFELAKERQKAVLSAILKNGAISEEDYKQAVAENLKLQRGAFAKKAPHFVDYVLSNCGPDCGSSGGPNGGHKIITTLDLGMQERVENIIESDLTFLSKFNIENAAVVILDVKTGDILTMVGSADYDDPTIQGAVNITTSLRQPGSSIKPLVYAMAFEQGWLTDTVVSDEPVRFETEDGLPYSPQNFDLVYHGEVTLAEALAQSLNIPAVQVMDFVGVASFLSRVRDFGITTLDQPAEHYGLSLALGSGEVRLLELTNAYSVFANEGQRAIIRFLLSDEPDDLESVIRPETAQAISAILSSNDLRMPAFGEENPLNLPFPVAAKTGTTRNFRDNWTLGYTDDYAVGVWVGNARGEVMEGVSGITGAGPIFYKVMMMLNEMTGTKLTVQPLQIDVTSRAEEPALPEEFRIITPFANDVFLFDPTKPSEFQKIKLEASASAEWFVDGQRVGEGLSVLWPLERGEHQIRSVADQEERVVEIVVR